VTGFKYASGYGRADPAVWYTCEPCNKRGYTTRREAKKCEKALVKKGDKASALDVYRCRNGTTYWHVGHNRGAN